ncbi:hypothetical protein niasHT_013736 [Heterodera trifolii]|uniref:Uncharacterized protein n=1 Tax=Heterodera trifolii TaxID=157864 RepID=A0ABD2LBU5_9BILA
MANKVCVPCVCPKWSQPGPNLAPAGAKVCVPLATKKGKCQRQRQQQQRAVVVSVCRRALRGVRLAPALRVPPQLLLLLPEHPSPRGSAGSWQQWLAFPTSL